MGKMRIYEYAKKQNVTSKVIIEKLKELGQSVSSHMSVVEDELIKKLDQHFTTNQNKQKNEKDQKSRSAQKGQGSRKSNQGNNKDHAQLNKNEAKNVRPNKQRNNKRQYKKNNHHNKRNRNHKGGQVQTSTKPQKLPKKITHTGSLTVAELADKLYRDSSEIIKKLMALGVMATKNEELSSESIELLLEDYGVEVSVEQYFEETDFQKYLTEDHEKDLQGRPPVVTIMGHVDHGKTTLLDSIRHTKVTAGEAGGITQHIGAYQIEENGKKITFLDTPGHAAFTTMRARGAQATDITILVVGADDGVMPQTVEAINHAKAAEVPIIVAVNKMDKEGANKDRVMQELSEHGLIPEDWGGDTIFVSVSALNNEGIDELLEMINLVAELEEYKANPDRPAFGTVIEAQLDKGRGSVATLLVQAGTLHVGDAIVVGGTFGRVRTMVNDLGRRVKTANPSTPVEITGLQDVPHAGDQFLVFTDEKQARSVGEARSKQQVESQRKETSKVNLEDLFAQIKEGDMKEINIIIKADVQGSAEALAGSLQKIEVEGAKINIIHTGVGGITESDIILAAASNALIIGFNVRPDSNSKKTADAEKVDIRLYSVIYNAIEEVEAAMKGMLDPEYEEKIIGQVEVRATFKVSKIGVIAGAYVTDGKITRHSGVRLIRDGKVVYEGGVDTLKRFKDDVKEVSAGYECGITLEKFNDIKEGDIIEAYIMAEKPRT
jgi:translation initiation factor IF-2